MHKKKLHIYKKLTTFPTLKYITHPSKVLSLLGIVALLFLCEGQNLVDEQSALK